MKKVRVTHLLIPALALLLLALATLLNNPIVSADPVAAELVSGTYDGSVTVSEPAALGALALRLDINSANGLLTGQVNPIKTQVFLGGPTFTGQVTVTQGTTPTVRMESQVFSSKVSGRMVQRRFVLTGVVLDGGDGLRGEYTETVLGFTAEPMLIKGTFLLSRPDGLPRVVTVPAPDGSTPTATPPTPGNPPTVTPTATRPGNSGPQNSRLYLPLISKHANTGNLAAVEGVVEMITVESASVALTATPTPTATVPALVAPTDMVTPTVAAASEASQQSYLPLINQ